MIQVRVREDSMLVDQMGIEPNIFGMHMIDPIDELSNRLEVIHMLEYQVGGVVVEPQVRTPKIGKKPPPNRGRTGDVLAAWPFVGRENHRAILNPNAHRVFLSKIHQRPPSLEHPGPIVLDALGVIASYEGIDLMDPQSSSRCNHLLEMLTAPFGLLKVRG